MSNQQYGYRHGPTNTNTPDVSSYNGRAGRPDTDRDRDVAERKDNVTRTVTQAAHQVVDSVSEKVAEAERRLRETAASNEEALRQATDKTAVKAQDLKKRANRFVNNNPLAAAGIAFVAGIVTAAWMRK